MTTRRKGQARRRAKRRSRLTEQHGQHDQHEPKGTTQRQRDRRTDD